MDRQNRFLEHWIARHSPGGVAALRDGASLAVRSAKVLHRAAWATTQALRALPGSPKERMAVKIPAVQEQP